MQARAIFARRCVAERAGAALPEVMIPLVCAAQELAAIRGEVDERGPRGPGGNRCPDLVGTMIELPRAALLAGEIARPADFLSFGTNDLTQTTWG